MATSSKNATPPTTRRERRAQERAERQGQPRPRRSRVAQPTPWWKSPMALFTGGALLVGLAVIAFSFLNQPPAPTDELIGPATVIPAGLADGRSLGSADAPVTVEIWSDFQCPACRLFAQRTEPGIITDFVVPGTARLVYRDAAFLGHHAGTAYDESVEAAAAARGRGAGPVLADARLDLCQLERRERGRLPRRAAARDSRCGGARSRSV